MKYLGLVLDSRWFFREHFHRLFPKALKMAAALGRLMTNTGGPEECRRRVYATCYVRCLVWGPCLAASGCD